MHTEIRNYNAQIVQRAIQENKGLKTARMKSKEGKSIMVGIRNQDGSIVTDRSKIVERCADF